MRGDGVGPSPRLKDCRSPRSARNQTYPCTAGSGFSTLRRRASASRSTALALDVRYASSSDPVGWGKEWVLVKASRSASKPARALSVWQAITRTTMRGKPMAPWFSDDKRPSSCCSLACCEAGTYSERSTAGKRWNVSEKRLRLEASLRARVMTPADFQRYERDRLT
jgi:hypothetical protein